MDEAEAVDLNFTYAIVGAPVSVSLGRRLGPLALSAQGVTVGMREMAWELGTSWMEWWMLHGGEGGSFGVRRRPGPLRRWLERRALVIAVLGLLMLGASSALILLRLP